MDWFNFIKLKIEGYNKENTLILIGNLIIKYRKIDYLYLNIIKSLNILVKIIIKIMEKFLFMIILILFLIQKIL